ncbi:neural cell adhesion molecule 1 isoform X2 [Drosophila guanche]|uniref:Blast:Lachesin n=1 Tax=Drosophila guanche TaxID=7266 RepID=A0A3B0JF21_DROGU|nr:neural cell adhesion molecule 1 isoform X2 [Drosophila guanche]SPP80725.1 blast:Lachesin [Drosophila guanche]
MHLTNPCGSNKRSGSSNKGATIPNTFHSNKSSNKMARITRTISQQRHHIHERSLPHTLLLAIAAIALLQLQHFESVCAQSMMTKNEPMFISRSETFKFITGETIVLPCEVANTDTYVVAWKRGIAILTAGSVKVTPDPRVRLVNGFNLQIREALPTDAGDYICQIATMDPREITHTVEILVPPRIHHISTGGHLQVKKGSSVRIECSATGNPMPNVTWSRKNNILPNGEEKLHSHVLSIENVDRHKGGVYICTANNRVGQPASSQVVLHVLYSPEIAVERPVVFSGEGHEAMLVCIVHGETQPEVIWFKDTMQLDTTERHIMETRGSRHTLIIRKVHPQDFGNYSCVAENQLGKARKTLQLSGKPNVAVFNSPPISQYKDRYNISWAVDSHSPIEEYKLSFRKLPQGHEVVGNAIDSQSSSSSLSSSQSSSSSSSQMYGSGLHSHHIGSNIGLGGGSLSGGVGMGSYGGYGNLMHWGRNDWRNVVLPAMPLSHHYSQGMSYMVRGLDPDQHYEATVQSRNRYGWSDLTNSFVFSTSSNDNEMRDLSVTFYGSSAINRQKLGLLALSSATLILSLIMA